jgi:hypothetical protein
VSARAKRRKRSADDVFPDENAVCRDRHALCDLRSVVSLDEHFARLECHVVCRDAQVVCRDADDMSEASIGSIARPIFTIPRARRPIRSSTEPLRFSGA